MRIAAMVPMSANSHMPSPRYGKRVQKPGSHGWLSLAYCAANDEGISSRRCQGPLSPEGAAPTNSSFKGQGDGMGLGSNIMRERRLGDCTATSTDSTGENVECELNNKRV
jgi:hypothetical protein